MPIMYHFMFIMWIYENRGETSGLGFTNISRAMEQRLPGICKEDAA
jgi:hypothetical protein